MVVKESM